MQDFQLNDMALFVEIARLESFSRAATQLGLPASTLSRRMKAFEQHLGVRLLNRTTRHVSLTEEGLQYYQDCQKIVEEARQATLQLTRSQQIVQGTLRVSMPVDLANHYLAGAISRYCHDYPDIMLELDLSARRVHLPEEPFDVAVRLGQQTGSGLIIRCIGMVDQELYATPALAARLKRPEDITGINCLRLGQGVHSAPWHFFNETDSRQVWPQGRITANNITMLRHFAVAGLGAGVFAHAMVASQLETGQLVRCLPDWHMQPIPVYALTTTRLLPAKTRYFISALQAGLGHHQHLPGDKQSGTVDAQNWAEPAPNPGWL